MALTEFGRFLQKARVESGTGSQEKVSKKVSKKLRRKVSQSMIAQYETGKVADPDPAIIEALAGIYGRDYLEFVFQLVREKYDLDRKDGRSEEFQWRVLLLRAVLDKHESVGEVEGLEPLQLKGKTHLLNRVEILDMGGIAQWLDNFPELEEVWVVSPKYFFDNLLTHDVICQKLVEGVKVCFFVDDENIEKGKDYRSYLNFQLEHTLGLKNKKARNKIIDSHVLDVCLNVGDLRWLNMDFIVANPKPPFDGIGFGILRIDRFPSFAFRLDETEVNRLLLALSVELYKVNEEWLPQAKKEHWFA